MLECFYSAAQDAWGNGRDYRAAQRAKNYLDMVPEPALLAVVGLILAASTSTPQTSIEP